MTRRKRKRSIKDIPPEILDRVERTAAGLLEYQPGGELAEDFASACQGLAGYETAVIEALARSRSVAALNLLHRLAPTLADKALAKAARRAIYSLEQAGLEADPEVRVKRTSILQAPPERRASGYLSPYDPGLVRVGVLALPSVGSGFDVGFFLLGQADGLRSFKALNTSGGGLRRMLKNMGGPDTELLIEVPPGHARLVLSEAAARAQQLGRPGFESYEDFRPLAGSVPMPRQPAVYDFLSAARTADLIDFEVSLRDLLDQPLLSGFIISSELEPYLVRLREVEDSVLILSPAQKEERRQAILEQAGREIFGNERKAALKRALEETAFLFWKTGEQDSAALVLSAALDLDREAGPLSPYHFIRAVVRHSFDLLIGTLEEMVEGNMDRGQGRETGSGLILPGDF